MKNLLIALAFTASVSSCVHVAGDKENADSTAAANAAFYERWGNVADTSIDSATAYNNMFIDSSAVNTYIRTNKLHNTEAEAIRRFYNMRNYQFAWFAPDGLTEQGRSFWNLFTYGNKDNSIKELRAHMDSVVEKDTLNIAATDTTFRNTEVAITHRFVQYYGNSNNKGLLQQLPISFLLPIRKADPKQLADTLLRYTASITDTSNKAFTSLKQQLAMYDSIVKKGGWATIAPAGNLRKGSSSPAIAAIKQRLIATGDYHASDTSARYTDSLDIAVKSFQERHGFKPDGVISDSLVTVMNVPAEQRLQQILVNMNRVAWLPPQVKDHYVAVNIPEFMLHVHKGDSIPVSMAVVVGKEGTNTMMFTGNLNEVVFSPAWNIPESIVQGEILPAMQKDPNYLKKKNMEMVKDNDSIPQIKQLPGPGNALGKVKFLFPNAYDIYLHDTEAKGLFNKDKRAFSHGCIRLEDAEKMTRYVLQDQSEWNAGKIKQAMNSRKEQHVQVKQPLPVMITYLTTWVDNDGKMHFRDDIYLHDKRTAAMMFSTNRNV